MIHHELSSMSSISSYSSFSEEDIPTNYHLDIDDIVVRDTLNQAKFTIYLAFSPSRNAYYAMKVFPYVDEHVNPYFLNEIRFANLKHKNIISCCSYEIERETIVNDQIQKVSYVLNELAPFGDFFELLLNHKIKFDEVLLRTYFHQLIEGLEYLHSNGVYHLDIKLENLLLGEDFNLKIIDFDLAHLRGEIINERGTKDYRAPEIRDGTCINPAAADIFSAAIVLFVLKSGGILPQSEDQLYKGKLIFDILEENPEEFWKMHSELLECSPDFWSEQFKSMFISMVEWDPENRATLQDIKRSEWYNGPIYQYNELCEVMKNLLSQAQ